MSAPWSLTTSGGAPWTGDVTGFPDEENGAGGEGTGQSPQLGSDDGSIRIGPMQARAGGPFLTVSGLCKWTLSKA